MNKNFRPYPISRPEMVLEAAYDKAALVLGCIFGKFRRTGKVDHQLLDDLNNEMVANFDNPEIVDNSNSGMRGNIRKKRRTGKTEDIPYGLTKLQYDIIFHPLFSDESCNIWNSDG